MSQPKLSLDMKDPRVMAFLGGDILASTSHIVETVEKTSFITAGDIGRAMILGIAGGLAGLLIKDLYGFGKKIVEKWMGRPKK